MTKITNSKVLILLVAIASVAFASISFSETVNAQDEMMDNLNDDSRAVQAKAIPKWVDNNFKWYGQGQISQSDLLNSMKFLLDNNIMHISEQAAKEVKELRDENKALKKKLDVDGLVGPKTTADQSSSEMTGADIVDENGVSHGFILAPSDVDINALVQQVIKESYMETSKDLQFYAEKVRHYNDQKEAIRSHLSDIREHQSMHSETDKAQMAAQKSQMTGAMTATKQVKAKTLTDAGKLGATTRGIIDDIILKKGGTASAWEEGIAAFSNHGMRDSVVDDLQGIVVLCNTEIDKKSQRIDAELKIVEQWLKVVEAKQTSDPATSKGTSYNQSDLDFIRKKLSSIDSEIKSLDTGLKVLEDKLQSTGDDAQLANIDLQNSLQKQQQTLQMMSNMQKALHDTAMSIIRKIG